MRRPRTAKHMLNPPVRNIWVSEDGLVVIRRSCLDVRGYRQKEKILLQSPTSNGYMRVSSPHGEERLVHRLAAAQYLEGWDSSLEVDHIDGNRRNNHISNLRLVTFDYQSKAYQSPRGGTSKYRGVFMNSRDGNWLAYCGTGKDRLWSRNHKSENDAALAYDRMARKLGYFDEALNINNFPELKENNNE
jgi:hypothetical protein